MKAPHPRQSRPTPARGPSAIPTVPSITSTSAPISGGRSEQRTQPLAGGAKATPPPTAWRPQAPRGPALWQLQSYKGSAFSEPARLMCAVRLRISKHAWTNRATLSGFSCRKLSSVVHVEKRSANWKRTGAYNGQSNTMWCSSSTESLAHSKHVRKCRGGFTATGRCRSRSTLRSWQLHLKRVRLAR